MTQSRTHTCGALRLSDAGKTVTLCGWMENVRVVGSNFAFVVLRDFYGTTQIVVETEDMMSIVKTLNKESTIQVTGTVRERASKNPKLATGEIEVVPEKIVVLGYSALPFENQAFVIRDADGAFVSELFWARYGASDGRGWITLDFDYDATRSGLGQSYIVDGTYEEAYYYTTQSGYEFLITADSGTVWASCYTDKAGISLYGAYLTTAELEQIVEHLSISIRE